MMCIGVLQAAADEDILSIGVVRMDLSNRGVGIALDGFNEAIVPFSMLSEVYAAADQIVSGDLTVHDYTSDDSCPVLTF